MTWQRLVMYLNWIQHRKCRENGQDKEPSTTVLYTPLINRKPADPTTMLSAMLEA